MGWQETNAQSSRKKSKGSRLEVLDTNTHSLGARMGVGLWCQHCFPEYRLTCQETHFPIPCFLNCPLQPKTSNRLLIQSTPLPHTQFSSWSSFCTCPSLQSSRFQELTGVTNHLQHYEVLWVQGLSTLQLCSFMVEESKLLHTESPWSQWCLSYGVLSLPLHYWKGPWESGYMDI